MVRVVEIEEDRLLLGEAGEEFAERLGDSFGGGVGFGDERFL